MRGYLGARRRLERPPLCPQDLYDLMMWCWEQLYQFRPTFKEVKAELKAFQESQQQFQINPSQEFSSQDNSNENYRERNHSNGGDSGFEHSGANFMERLQYSNQQDSIQEISDQSHSEEDDSDQNVSIHEYSDNNETNVEQDCKTLKATQTQLQSRELHDSQSVIFQNHSELENSNESGLEYEHSDQNKTDLEEELTNVKANQHQPKSISNPQHTNKITSTEDSLKSKNFNRSDSGFEGSDQNEKDFQYIDAQTLIRGIENSNQINHQIVMVSNPIYNL